MGQGHKTINFGILEVKEQGHVRKKYVRKTNFGEISK